MKYFLPVFTLLLLNVFYCEESAAQQRTTEIQIGTGFGTAPNIFDAVKGIATTVGSLGSVTRERTSLPAGFTIRGRSRVLDRLSLGGTYVYQPFNNNLIRDGSVVGTERTRWHSLMGAGEFYWVNRRSFGFFSGAGLGVTFANEKQKDTQTGEESTGSLTTLAFQLNVLGFEFGNQFNGSIRFGIGYEGLATASLGYRF